MVIFELQNHSNVDFKTKINTMQILTPSMELYLLLCLILIALLLFKANQEGDKST